MVAAKLSFRTGRWPNVGLFARSMLPRLRRSDDFFNPEEATMNGMCRNGMAAAVLAAGAFALPAQAAYFCNFEDGLLCGWLQSTTGGTGSTGVETHNGSKMAFAQHTGALTHALSQDFAYSATDVMSFAMHAVANVAGNGANAGSGVQISFLNAFNVPLGSAGLYNVTSTTWLGVHDSGIDNFQHDYSGTLGSFAVLAGLRATDPIAKVSVSFTATAQTSNFGNQSSATVWFDNFTISNVPEPSQRAMLLAGLAAAALAVRRRRARD